MKFEDNLGEVANGELDRVFAKHRQRKLERCREQHVDAHVVGLTLSVPLGRRCALRSGRRGRGCRTVKRSTRGQVISRILIVFGVGLARFDAGIVTDVAELDSASRELFRAEVKDVWRCAMVLIDVLKINLDVGSSNRRELIL